MIDETVKDFIEEYIDKIDKEDWEFVFERWYTDCYAPSITNDEFLINEFFDTMAIAGIPALKERTREVRIKIITKKLDDVIQDRWGKYYSRIDSWSMYYSDIVTDLYTWLGFTREELYEILNNWNEAGLTPNPEDCAFEVEGL